MDLVALKTELDAGHPVTGAYDADSQDAANEVNALNIVRIRGRMAGSEVLDQTTSSEYKIKTPNQKSEWLSVCSIEALNPGDSQLALAVIDDIFGTGSSTHAAFIAARNETVGQSTAIELGRVRAADIIAARALP